MSEEDLINLLDKIANHEERIKLLEEVYKIHPVINITGDKKQKTLKEIIKGKKFKNGQEQIAIIVGYYEKVIETLLNKEIIKSIWESSKMDNKFSNTFIERAKDDLIRVNPDGICDLTQTGEDFFDNFIKNESI